MRKILYKMLFAGWAGSLCSVAVDECASSPCMNGAICLDMHANYACACPIGK